MSNINGMNFVMLSWRATRGNVAISSENKRLPHRFPPGDNTFIIIFVLIALLLVFMTAESPFLLAEKSSMGELRQLKSINLKKSENRLEVDIVLSAYTSHKNFILPNPNRLVIDLININEVEPQKIIFIDDFGLKSLRVDLIQPDIARVVFDLDGQIPSYRIRQTRDGIRVEFLRKEVDIEKKERVKDPVSGEQEEKIKREMGIKAEMAGRWEEAIDIYKSILRQKPSQKDLWLRISDIEAHLKRPKAAAEALEKAVQLSPEDASLSFRLVQAYSVANEPKLALNAIERVLKLDPKNLEYLRNQATLATWAGSYKIAVTSFKQILSIAPADNAAQLGLARVLSWMGELNESARFYKKYIKGNSEDKTAVIEHARVEAWRGNYPSSLGILENYRRKFGATDNYLQEKARVLALAMRPREALSMTTALLKKDPDNYELNVSHTIALNNSFYLKESLKSLDKVIRLEPDNPQTEETKLYVKTPMRPSLTPEISYYTDTSDLSIYRGLIEGGFSLQAPTRLRAGFEVDILNARLGSGLEQTNGKENARHDHIWVGVNHRLVPPIGLYGYLGRARVEDGQKKIITYRIGSDFWIADEIHLNLERSYDFFMVSPRTVGLGIKREINQIRFQWEPEIQYHLEANVSYATLSDTNRLWEVVFGARHLVARTEDLNLDLGIGAWLFGYRYDLNDGYYDPRLYQRYMATSFGYWKLSKNDGLGFILAAGLQKGSNSDRFRFSGTAELEGTFGIYRDLMLKIQGGIFELQLESGAYRSLLLQIGLTRRF